MKHSPELLVYKASAGSGKTFTLAVEYIKLLIQNPRAYRNILAVTFTNKATTEMKERILSQLYGIWIKDKDSDPYLQKITEELEMPQEDIRTAAGTALHYMIHDYSRFPAFFSSATISDVWASINAKWKRTCSSVRGDSILVMRNGLGNSLE